jgi:hypothetical protein
MVPLKPVLSGPRRCQAPRTVASRRRDSTRRTFFAGSASPPCVESEGCDGGALPRLLRARRAQGERHRVSSLAGRRSTTRTPSTLRVAFARIPSPFNLTRAVRTPFGSIDPLGGHLRILADVNPRKIQVWPAAASGSSPPPRTCQRPKQPMISEISYCVSCPTVTIAPTAGGPAAPSCGHRSSEDHRFSYK